MNHWIRRLRRPRTEPRRGIWIPLEYEFHDPELGEVAEFAKRHKAHLGPLGYVQMLNWQDTEGLGVQVYNAGWTTIADIYPWQPRLPANSVNVGTQFRFTGWGTYGITSTPTTTMGIYANGAASGTQLAITASQSPTAATVNCWQMQAYGLVTATGSSGTIRVAGDVIGIGATATTPILMPAATILSATLNTQQANSFAIAASWSASSASNTYSTYGWLVEQLN